MNIYVKLHISEVHAEAARLSCDPFESVHSVQARACEELGLSPPTEFELHSHTYSLLNPYNSMLEEGVVDGDTVYLTVKDDGKIRLSKGSSWLLASLALLVGIVGIGGGCGGYYYSIQIPSQYGIVMDAGSTHTELYVYEWRYDDRVSSGNLTFLLKEWHCRTDVGVASVEPSGVNALLSQCLTKAKEHIPSTLHGRTPIYFGATAGMRLLNISNPVKSTHILYAVRDSIRSFPFALKKYGIISGQEEAAAGWLSTKFNTNSSSSVADDVGSIDLGGASAEIAFNDVLGSCKGADVARVGWTSGTKYNLGVKSGLCYGVVQFYLMHLASLHIQENGSTTAVNDPCLQLGHSEFINDTSLLGTPCVAHAFSNVTEMTVVGLGKPDQCLQSHRKLLKGKASLLKPSCTVPVGVDFLGLSYLADVARFFEIEHSTPNAFRDAIMHFCGLPWQAAFKLCETKQAKLYRCEQYCSLGLYSSVLLTDIYGFNNDTWSTLTFGKASTGWSLGYLLNATVDAIQPEPLQPMSFVVFVVVLILSVCMCGFGLWFAGQNLFGGTCCAQKIQQRYLRLESQRRSV